MSGITLAIAEEKLALWLNAESALATSQSYEIEEGGGRRKLVRADLAEVRRQIEFWQGRIARANRVARRGRSRYIVN